MSHIEDSAEDRSREHRVSGRDLIRSIVVIDRPEVTGQSLNFFVASDGMFTKRPIADRLED